MKDPNDINTMADKDHYLHLMSASFHIWWEDHISTHPSPVIDTLMIRSTAFAAYAAAYDYTLDQVIDEIEQLGE